MDTSSRSLFLAAFAAFILTSPAAGRAADRISVPIHTVSAGGVGEQIGEVELRSSQYGLIVDPSLSRLPPGIHGLHLHEDPSCETADRDGKPEAAGAAGGHFDPDQTGRHAGPYEEGHLGDLPVLYVDQDGQATVPVLAPRLTLEQAQGRAIVVHKGADNYSDQPEPLGGGGPRLACGVIPDRTQPDRTREER